MRPSGWVGAVANRLTARGDLRRVVAGASVLAALAVSCSGGASIPDECIVKANGATVRCSESSTCGAGAECDTAASPSTCVKTACLPAKTPCSTNGQCKSGTCTSSSSPTGSEAGSGSDGGSAASKGTCSETAGDGGGGDAGKPNPCVGKMNYVFDDATTLPNGFTLKTCAAFAEVEKMVETDATRASQFITPLAGAKLPVSKPYKFSWSKAMFPNAPMPGMDPNKVNDVAYVVYFIDVNTSRELLRVHTINQDYTPDDAAWAKLIAAATMPNAPGLQLKIYAAFFVDDTIPMGTNPVTGTQPRLVLLDLTM